MSQSPPPVPLSLPASNPKKRPSQSSGASVSAQPAKKPRTQHPLRQTSFPASADFDPRVYSGSVAGASARSEVDGGSVAESFTGSAGGSFGGSIDDGARGKRRKKGKKGQDGTSVRGTATERSVGQSGGAAPGAEDEEEDEDLEDADLVGEDGGAADAVAEKENLAILIDAFTPEQSARYDLFKRTKLNKATLRRIVNQTLSQSVPPAVITTVSGFTKVFIGEIIEKARTVQSEWADAGDNGAIQAAKKAEAEAEEAERAAQRAAEEAEHEKDGAESGPTENGQNGGDTSEAIGDTVGDGVKREQDEIETTAIKPEQSHEEQNTRSITPHTPQEQQPPPSTQSTVPDSPYKESAKLSSQLPPNAHRGPLLPSHLREALRRSKRSTEGGNVGFSGLSVNGYGVKGSLTWSVRGGGGRRLFR